MPSFTTIYRAVVMIAIGAISVTAWQLYGPSKEQVKSTFGKAVEMAEAAWNKQRSSTTDARLVANQSGPAPAAATAPQTAPSTSLVTAPAPGANVSNAGNAPAVNALQTSPVPTTPELITAIGPQPVAPTAVTPAVAPGATAPDERVSALIARLEKLGASDTKLSPWGSSGNLYRFCCRATPADSPALTQHFESVASEPAMAVEQVLAKVEAWRTARQTDVMLR